jgi:iron complex transport system ATP-binding protein
MVMLIEVRNGFFGYPGQDMILKDINFSLKQGEIMAILGQNGTGKTTMLKCLTGILKWKKGQTLINGKSLDSVGRLNEIGYVPQAHKLSFPYTVREMVAMGRARYIGPFSVPSKEDMEKVDEVIKSIGIEHLKNIPCTNLSGGQLQLVYIARALAADPKVLALDEPESHLDFKNQLMILKLIKRLVKGKNISCIMNTHYPEHALRISDKTMFLGSKGYILGKSREVITEENIGEYFDIHAKIVSIKNGNEDLSTIIAFC